MRVFGDPVKQWLQEAECELDSDSHKNTALMSRIRFSFVGFTEHHLNCATPLSGLLFEPFVTATKTGAEKLE